MRQKHCAQHSPCHSSSSDWVSAEVLLMVRIRHLPNHQPILDKDCSVELHPDIKIADLIVRPVSVAAGTIGLYLHPPSNLRLPDIMHSYTLFALHTSAPYVRKHVTHHHAGFKSAQQELPWAPKTS